MKINPYLDNKIYCILDNYKVVIVKNLECYIIYSDMDHSLSFISLLYSNNVKSYYCA